MSAPVYDRHGVQVHIGDCLDVMRQLPDASVHAIVTDPPAGIRFMNRAWDSDTGGRHSWVAWLSERMQEAHRVLKPGGYGLVWALPRTSHWTAWALEDAGFEIRDCVVHHFGNGMPKSKSQLKPASEHWWLIRKPLVGSVAANEAMHGTGSINVDACRVEGVRDRTDYGLATATRSQGATFGKPTERADFDASKGRWPANVVLSHGEGCTEGACGDDCPVTDLDAQSGTSKSPPVGAVTRTRAQKSGSMENATADRVIPNGYGDEGGASRFFPLFRWEAKAPTSERPMVNGKSHETVKPVALMRWMVRLVCVPGGTVLDCFAGSGTTGQAARAEGMRAVLIEQDSDHIDKIRARLDARPKTTATAATTEEQPMDLLDLLEGGAA